jgi:hypothetical protein
MASRQTDHKALQLQYSFAAAATRQIASAYLRILPCQPSGGYLTQ